MTQKTTSLAFRLSIGFAAKPDERLTLQQISARYRLGDAYSLTRIAEMLRSYVEAGILTREHRRYGLAYYSAGPQLLRFVEEAMEPA